MNSASLLHEELSVIADQGSGRAFITVLDDDRYLPLADGVVSHVAGNARMITVKTPAITNQNWRALDERLGVVIEQLGIRQASLIGLGAGATLAQNRALSAPKSVRSLVVVDASSRPHPSRWERFIDWLEERLPFGLPLRLGAAGFNVRAYLHRLRCPILVIDTHHAGAFISEELRHLARKAPTAWHISLRGAEAEQRAELAEAILSFQDTPAKCPQKNLREGANA